MPEFSKSRTLAAGCAALLASVALAGSAAAQTPSAEQMRLFPRLQAAPTDYDSNFAYAREAVAARDYEAAIVALERLLFFNPNLTRAKYELGSLYFRLRSYEMAIRYLEDALATPGVEEDIRTRIAVLLPAARREIQPSRFYGVLHLGLGYNSNATGVPGFGLVRAYGRPVLNPGPYYAKPDGNATLLGDIRHVYDFQNQRGDLWETSLTGIGQAQFRLGGLSAFLVEASTGPRLALAPDLLPGVTIRPYVVGSYSAAATSRLGSSVGAGVTLRGAIGETLSIEPGFEWRRLDVEATDFRLLSAALLNTGPQWTASLATRWSPLDRLTLTAKGFVGRNASYAGALSSRYEGVEVSAKYDFDPPFEQIGWRWSATPFVRYASYRFDNANPFVDPFVARGDRQWRIGSQFDMPITPMFGLAALVQYSRDNSNIPNYRATSWSGLIGPTLRF